jgi:hypothetical protein
MDVAVVERNVAEVVDRWSPELTARLQRRVLDRADFATLRDAGVMLTGVPADMGACGRGQSAQRDR